MKEVTVSTTDPGCGMFRKGEHKVEFAYTTHVACDKHNFILGCDVSAGNVHDSVMFKIQVLKYATTNREGYREYKGDPKICASCPSRTNCTESKKCQKTVSFHVWDKYLELVEDVRLSPEGRAVYSLRSQTIERFADAKEKHSMRYTHYRGLAKLRMQALLAFACMNLKKLAMWKQKNRLLPPLFVILWLLPPLKRKMLAIV